MPDPMDPHDQLDHPTISIVIPTYNSERTLRQCLASIRQEFPAPHEIIVIDDTRTKDQTRELCILHSVRVVIDAAGMAESRNIGAKLCSGEYILHLDSDMVLPPGFRKALQFELDASNADALVIPERSVGEGRWLRARQIDKDIVRHLNIGESVRLVRRHVMEGLGGYDSTLLAGEDADFDRRLHASGATVSRLTDSTIIHDDGRITLLDVARKKYRYGKTLRAYEQRNGTLYSREDVYRRVREGATWALRDNWLTAARYLVLKGVEFGAGALGRVSSASPEQSAVAKQASETNFSVSLMSVVGTTPSGGDLLILRLIRALTARGFSVRVITTQDQVGQADWRLILGEQTQVDIIEGATRWAPSPLSSYILRAIRLLVSRQTRGTVSNSLIIGSPFLPDLAMLLANRDAHSIFVTWQLDIPHPFSDNLRMQMLGMRLTEKAATQFRTAFSFASQALMLRVAAKLDCYLVVTNDSLEAACMARGISANRVIRGSCGVDLQSEPSRAREDRSVDFLFLGRLHSQKGFVDLLAAWHLISASLPDARLTVIGDGTGRFSDWCKQQIETIGASIDYRGPLEGDAKWSVLRNTRVLLFPSTYESFGIVALEAMAAGAVVVGYDTEVNRAAFGDGVLRVPPGNSSALAAAAVSCYTDHTLWERQHLSSQTTAAMYDWDTAADSLAQLIVEKSCASQLNSPNDS